MSSQRSATPWWFQATEVVPAEYLLQSATGRYLDVVAANPAAGARIQVWDRVAGENQQWTIVRSDEPGFIYLKSGMGRYLGVFAGSIKQGVPAQIEDFTGRNGQKRRLALTGLRMEGDGGLPEQPVGSRPAGLAGGVEPDARLADPGDERAGPGGQRHGGVGDARAGLEHDAGEAPHRNVDARPVGVHRDEGAVLHVELRPLDEDQRGPILERDRPWRRQPGESHEGARRISISPQPKALARPKPCASRARKAAGSAISSAPVMSRMPNCGWPARFPR